MKQPRRTQAERSEATQRELISAARRLFAERGYQATSTAELVREAGVTRGALYHHYAGKDALFRAVFERIEQEIHQRVLDALAAAEPAEPYWRTGLEAFLDCCTDPAVQRIALLDAPSVLGWDTWREIDSGYFLGLVTELLRRGMASGEFVRQPVEPIAHLLMGALTEAALAIARSPDPAAARAQFGLAATRLIDGLRAPAESSGAP